jgi:hypothetical protein
LWVFDERSTPISNPESFNGAMTRRAALDRYEPRLLDLDAARILAMSHTAHVDVGAPKVGS